ncbi:F-box domain-containing protein [Pacmanvirus A23]|uniref:F-box domain-containing protein n=1 Tax=Pacmanvirus A23 TaxID=1932881 RepID=UPI000A09192C|nr:F-box domain-containing protein [Pacmanvirus A23]SIP86066.1 F-box domain-containing protein [Pacmanvirus A23]
MTHVLFYDIYLEIFSHLTEFEYLPLRLVCKEWNNTIISIGSEKEIIGLIDQRKFLPALLAVKHIKYKKHNRPIKLFRHVAILPHFGLTKFLINHCGAVNLRIKSSIDRLIELLDYNPEVKNRVNCLVLLLNEWIKLGKEIDERIDLEYCCKVNSFELAAFARNRNKRFIKCITAIRRSLDIAFKNDNNNLVILITGLNLYQLTVDDYFKIAPKFIDIADDLLKKCNITMSIRIEAQKRLNLIQQTEKTLNSEEIQMINVCQKTISRIDSFDEFKKIIATNVLNRLINEKFKVNLNNIKMNDIIEIDWEKPWGFNYMINNTYSDVNITIKEIFNNRFE